MCYEVGYQLGFFVCFKFIFMVMYCSQNSGSDIQVCHLYLPGLVLHCYDIYKYLHFTLTTAYLFTSAFGS